MCTDCAKSDLTKLNAVFEQFKGDDHALISILQQAQTIYGYLPTDVLYAIAERTGNSPAKVMGVATFYTQFRLTPVGRHLVMLCKGTACHVNGADAIEKALGELGLVDGETTPDGLFSLKTEDTYGSLTPAKAKAIIEDLKAKEAAK